MKKLQTKRIRINPNCIWLLTIVFESRRKPTIDIDEPVAKIPTLNDLHDYTDIQDGLGSDEEEVPCKLIFNS